MGLSYFCTSSEGGSGFFVLDYLFKDVYIVNSLGRQKMCLTLEQNADM